MDSFAALMVIIACHQDGSGCVKEPVTVISYSTTSACVSAMQPEIEKAKRVAKFVYGDCVPVDPALLAGKAEIRRTMEPARLAAALSSAGSTSETAFASTDRSAPLPYVQR